MVLAFFAARAYCSLVVSLLSTKTTRSFSAKLHTSYQRVMMHGVIPPQLRGARLSFAELHEVAVSLFPQPFQISLNGSTHISYVTRFSRFGTFCIKLSTLSSIISDLISDSAVLILTKTSCIAYFRYFSLYLNT